MRRRPVQKSVEPCAFSGIAPENLIIILHTDLTIILNKGSNSGHFWRDHEFLECWSFEE